MINQDMIFPILPRPQNTVSPKDSKVQKVSERPVISSSEEEHKEATAEELDRIVQAMEQRNKQRQRHPQQHNKKLKKLQQMQQGTEDEEPPHLDITA